MQILIFVGTFVASVWILTVLFISRAEIRVLREELLAAGDRKAPAVEATDAPAAEAGAKKKKVTLDDVLPETDGDEGPEVEEEGDESGDENEDEEVDESGEEFKKAKVDVMRFLESAISDLGKSGMELDSIAKFGCHLFLAGAAESAGRSHKLNTGEFAKILESGVAVLGSGPDMAKKFAAKYDEYLLEPAYAKMFRAGGEAMQRFASGDIKVGKALSAALDIFRKPSSEQQDATVAVLFTDIVGSTKMTQTLGDAGAQKMVHLHNTVVRNALREHRGSEVKHTGDGIMASFPNSADAVRCGIAIQSGLAGARSRDKEVVLHIRVGINAGHPIAEDGDLFGTTVQIAARICDKAATDGVYVSPVVKDLASGSGVKFADKGQFEMKGVPEPITLWAAS
ncbi:MAG: adenylate/guanylate cyclase domain-containing protein [Proteobacteria bacterium]|nr:adenylate/guanylate cyclase domain-containing protein [Pseudomonadota bacterium]MDA1131824.1 adenylate/guanylate cyclase domain-containing protein [Pseudomonadota bacterium]